MKFGFNILSLFGNIAYVDGCTGVSLERRLPQSNPLIALQPCLRPSFQRSCKYLPFVMLATAGGFVAIEGRAWAQAPQAETKSVASLGAHFSDMRKSDVENVLRELEDRGRKAQLEGVPTAVDPDAAYRAPLFRSGEERVSEDKLLETSLNVIYDERKAWRPEIFKALPAGAPMESVRPAEIINLRMRSYDELAVGPTLRVKPGDVLRVRLNNKLPIEKPREHDENVPDLLNRTNLHTHGLHVTPAANGDNVLLELNPTESHLVEIAIPKDHIPGTFWYHSHVHGTTAAQVSSGMAGAIIIEAPIEDRNALDNIPGIKDAEERIMVLQQLSFTPAVPGELDPAKTRFELESFNSAFQGVPRDENPQNLSRWNLGKLREGWRTTINGQLLPVLRIKSGQTQRLRLIHAGVREVINFQIAPLVAEGEVYRPDQLTTDGMREIARDGIPLDRMHPTDSIQLYPGYRSDVLLKLNNRSSQVQRYAIWDGQSEEDRSLLNPIIDHGDATKQSSLLALIEVEPEHPKFPEIAWPSMNDFSKITRLASISENEVEGRQQVVFGIGGTDADGNPTPGLHINGQRYSRDNPSWPLKIGRTDEWLLSSRLANHPFHIHVNPFYLVSSTTANGETTYHNVWKDTLLVQQNTQYRVLTRYENYLGPFVIHCHILDHEDQGMMQGVEVVNSAFDIGTKLAKPYYRPLWTLPDATGTPKPLADVLGPNLNLVVFLENQACAECNKQMEAYRKLVEPGANPALPEGVKVVFLAPGARPEDGSFPGPDFPFPVFFDENLAQFKSYGAYLPEHKSPLHGTFILSKEGQIFWKEVSDRPYMDIRTLLKDRRLILDQLALEASRHP